MGEDNFAMGYALGQDSNGGNNGGMFGGGDGWWGIILLALLFGWGGNRGFGGGGGSSGGGGGFDGVSAGFAWQGIDSGIRGIQQGICDATYSLNNSIMTGFHGVDNAICTLGYQTQSGFNTLGHQISDCCCQTQRAIDGVNYNMAKGFCDLGNVITTQTRDIIDNQNANYRGLMDFMVQSKMDALRTENESLRLRASQADQNAVIRAAIDASTAEIIRRTGNECPIPAYVVPNPNCCYGNPLGVGYNYGGNSGCGCA